MMVDKVANIKGVNPVQDTGASMPQNKGSNVAPAKTKVDSKQLKNAMDKLNKVLELFNVERRFVIDDRTKEIVVKIIDKSSGEVILQIPPEEALERYYRMEQFIGLIFNEKA